MKKVVQSQNYQASLIKLFIPTLPNRLLCISTITIMLLIFLKNTQQAAAARSMEPNVRVS